MNKYDHFISLGHACQPAHNIRNILGQHEAYLFDWLVTPMPAVLMLLAPGGIDRFFGNKKSFENIDRHKNNIVVIHRPSEVVFYHDFTVREDLKALDKVYAKYKFLYKRTDQALKTDKVLLIRHHCSKAEAVNLKNVLYKLYPSGNIDLLIVNDGPVQPSWSIDRIVNMTINPAGVDWRGDMAGWSQILKQYGGNK